MNPEFCEKSFANIFKTTELKKIYSNGQILPSFYLQEENRRYKTKNEVE